MPLVLAIDQDVSRIFVAAHMRAFANAHWSHLTRIDGSQLLLLHSLTVKGLDSLNSLNCL